MDREGLNHQRGRLVCFNVDHSNHVRLRLTPESHRLEFDSLLTHTRLSRTHTVSATSYLTNTNTTAHSTLVPLCVSSLRPYGPWWRSLLNIIDRSGRRQVDQLHLLTCWIGLNQNTSWFWSKTIATKVVSFKPNNQQRWLDILFWLAS